jgi:hypothetical protein
MPMRRDVCPLAIALPDGRRAEYIAGTRPAKYTIDGEPCDIDVMIPEDLAATGWYWSGSYLYRPWPSSEDGRGVPISTATYGVPGVFEAACRFEAKRDEVLELRLAKPAKKARKAASITPKVRIPDRDAEHVSNIVEQLELAL